MKKKLILLLLLMLIPVVSVSAEELEQPEKIIDIPNESSESTTIIPDRQEGSGLAENSQQGTEFSDLNSSLPATENTLEKESTGWIEENGNKYYLENGNKVTGFKTINGQTYFFSRDTTRYGVMRTGKFEIDGYYYCFDDTTGALKTGFFDYGGNKYYTDNSGKIQKGFQVIDGKTYFFSRDTTRYGVMRTGKFEIDGDYYCFDDVTGILKTDFFEYGGNKYYTDNSGKIQKGFQQIGGETYFFSRDTTRYGVMRTGKFEIDGYYYCFDDTTGALKTGFFEYGGNKYYTDNTGKIQKGFQVIDGETYFFSRDTTRYGVMRTGKFEIDGYYYCFDDTTGALKTGFFEYGGNKYYTDNSGKIQMGFQEIDGETYFFSRDTTRYGVMRTGKFEIDGYYYCFDDTTGALKTGFFEYGENKYYTDNSGKIQKGFQQIDGETYFFSRDTTRYGVMRTGKFEIDGYYYCFDDTTGALKRGFFEYGGDKYYTNTKGQLQTGFQTIGGKRYFFSRDTTRYGVMRYGWIEYNQYRYYLDNDGTVVTGYKNIDGRDYMFDEQGRMNTGFVTVNGNTYYYYADGTYANDWLQIGNTKYFFNSLGVQIGANVKKIIDVSYHQGVIDWDTVAAEGNIDGVILRIAAGCEEEDTQLARNISELKRLGIPYGIYIYSYAENYNEGRLYAEFTVNVIKKYGMNPTLGIYLDLESNSVTSYMGVTEYTNVVNGYMDVMKANGYGNNTKIYTYKNYADTALNSEYLRSLIAWIAQYNHYCTYTGSYVGWQYSSTERVPGINTNVDVNVWFN